MNELLKQHLLRAQHRMKSQADKNRSERSFSVGELVYLKLQPYVQSSVLSRSSNKLSFKFFGPYEILEKIGAVAYKLKLPPSDTIHPVFHVSQLKQAPPADHQVLSDLPPADLSLQFPVQVLQRRLVTRGTEAVTQALIQWSGLPSSLATWEDEVPLKQKFPQAPAWGHAGSQGRGSVTSPRTPRTRVPAQWRTVEARDRLGPTRASSAQSGPISQRVECVSIKRRCAFRRGNSCMHQQQHVHPICPLPFP